MTAKLIMILCSAICKIIPWANVNDLCHIMSIFIHVAPKNVRTMPRSIYNMGNYTCHMLNFIDIDNTNHAIKIGLQNAAMKHKVLLK